MHIVILLESDAYYAMDSIRWIEWNEENNMPGITCIKWNTWFKKNMIITKGQYG